VATTQTVTDTAAPAKSWLARFFDPATRGSTPRIEFIAGLTTFVTMAYIIFVNTGIMQAAGLNPTALTIGTIIAAIVPTLAMGLWADLPWALAPGLGYNALFAFTVVLGYHVPVYAALALVFLDGLAFTLIVAGPWRERIITGIPLNLKLAAGAGIGLFIAFIGLVNAGIVKFSASSTIGAGSVVPFGGGTGLPELSPLNDPAVIVALVGIILTALLMRFRVRGALLLSIIGTTAIAWATALLKPDTRAALLPGIANPKGLSNFVAMPDFGTFFSKGVAKMDFTSIFTGKVAFGTVLLFFVTFLVTDMMDSLGTFSGLATKLGILDNKGNFPRSGRALVVDAAAGMWGPITGNATIATFIESASGVGEGGKTGLTAFWVAAFFFLALFFVPFVGLVPAVATAPVLIIVGYLMIEPIVKIDLTDVTEGVPAFLALLIMPLTYSIADGMFMGIVSYVLLKLLTGKVRAISVTMWVFAVLLLVAKFLQAGGLKLFGY
jgi:AGZA family xanthine/uracil permease-like MFS transporter